MVINDFHLHSTLSHDSDTAPADFTRRAHELGLSAIGFSEHKDFDPADPQRDYFDYDKTKTSIDKLRRDNPDIQVLFGLEVDYRSWLEEEIAAFLKAHPFDYVIGSVHYISEYKPLTVQLADQPQDQLYQNYFREVAACAKSGLFDILGHADYVKRVAEERYGPYSLAEHHSILEEIVDAAISHELVLESNTKALRLGLSEPFPSYDLLKLYAEHGGKKITLASDAHKPEEMCYKFKEVWQKVEPFGLELWQPTVGNS